MVIQMSEVHLRQRIASAKAVARKAPVKSMTGFVVEKSPLVKLGAKGEIPLDDDGMLPLGDE